MTQRLDLSYAKFKSTVQSRSLPVYSILLNSKTLTGGFQYKLVAGTDTYILLTEVLSDSDLTDYNGSLAGSAIVSTSEDDALVSALNASSSPFTAATTSGIKIDGTGYTQPVSGTVTANIGTSGSLALDATLTGGTAKNQVRGGTKGATTPADVTSTAEGADHQALDVQIYHGGTAKDPTQVRALTNADVVSAELTKWIGSTAPTVGQKTSANSLPVVIASDQSAVTVTGSVTNPSVGTSGSAIPASSTLVGGSDGTNLQPFRVFDLDSGAGTQYVTGVGLRKAASGGSVEAGTASDPLRTDPTGTTTQPVSGTVTANIGTSGSLALDATLAKLTITQGTALGANTQALAGASVTTAAPTYTTGQISPLNLNTAGGLRVDGSGVTQPVSGTVTANIGTSGSLALDATLAKLTVAQGTALGANTQALAGASVTTAAPTYTTGQISPLNLNTAGGLRVDGSGVTQPVSGTVTANIGTSGSLALDATLAKLTVAQGASLGANTQALAGGSVTTASPTYTTGQVSPLNLTTAGALRVDGSAVTQPVSGTVTSNQGTAAAIGSAWPVKVTDGTSTNTVKAASTASVATDTSIVVGLSPNSPISGFDGTNPQKVATDTNGVSYTADIAMAAVTGRIANAQAGRIFGLVATSATTEVAIRETTYTEQASGAQRSMNSLNAADASAGTGARTVQITYYTLSGTTITGPFVETITMNGVTAVNTVATNIALIEKLEVLTVGSTNSNVGAIQLFTTTAGGGSVFASIAATKRKTNYAHHYIPNTRTCYLTDMMVVSTAANGNVPDFNCRTFDYGSASAERFLIEGFGGDGSNGSFQAVWKVPRKVAGPARLVFYVTPANGAGQTQKLESSFFEI